MSKPSAIPSSKQEKKPLQAVVLADSFMTPHRFRPFTIDTPKVLLPLVNAPMIEYTLEFLATGGVEDIIILACSHADQISNYIKNSRWASCSPEITVRVVISQNSKTVGDALRHIAGMGVIVSDFVLISGDVVANMNLKTIVAEHKVKCAQDDDMIMTMVFKEVKPHHAMRSVDDDLIVAMSSDKKQLLKYSNNCHESEVGLSEELFNEHSDIDLHYNLLDTHITVCAPRILQVFEENFDYCDLRKDFVRLMLSKDESDVVDPDKIFCHVITEAYAARVNDLRTYHTISHDIIRRWLSPITVNNNLLAHTTYEAYPNNVYREACVDVARGVILGTDCVLARGTVIKAGCNVTKFICGEECMIEEGTTVATTYCLRNAKIGKNCIVEGAFLGNNVVIKDGARVCKGAVIGDNVIIGTGVVVPAYAAITAAVDLADEEEDAAELYQDFQVENEEALPLPSMEVLQRDLSPAPVFSPHNTPASSPSHTVSFTYNPLDDPAVHEQLPSATVVGPDGKGRVFLRSPHETYGAAIALVNSICPPSYIQLRNHPLPAESCLNEFLLRDDDYDYEDEDDVEEVDPSVKFFREVYETLARGHFEGLKPDDIVLELSGLKFASAQNLDVYAAAVTIAWLKLAGFPHPLTGLLADNTEPQPFKLTAAVLTTLTKIVKSWRLAMQKYCRQEDDQIKHVLPGVLYACMMNKDAYVPVFASLIKLMYEEDIVSDEAVTSFYTNRVTTLKTRKNVTKSHQSCLEENYDIELLLLQKLKPVVEWLNEDEDEDEDEDDEE